MAFSFYLYFRKVVRTHLFEVVNFISLARYDRREIYQVVIMLSKDFLYFSEPIIM